VRTIRKIDPEDTMKRIHSVTMALALSSLAVTMFQPLNAQVLAPAGGIATWSVQTNTSSWNQALGVKYTRQGCSGTPTYCTTFAANLAKQNHVVVTLAIPLTTATPAEAKQYSTLSRTTTSLVEVSIDDFVDQFCVLPGTALLQPWTVVAETILNLKSANPKLAFGITLYEDDLTSPYLQNAKLPAAVRGNVDFVHLFLHYRENGPNFASYVLQAKQLFPHAHIVAGSYAYDRRAFLPCAPKGISCTEPQDLALFKQSLTIQAQEMRQGVVDYIEFYPGYFGNESQWTGWSNPRHCASGELTACIDNTIIMRDAALEILNTVSSSAPTWKQLSPSNTPPVARYAQSTAMDPGTHRMILFGGTTFSAALNDTWILTGADGQHGASFWYRIAAKNPPPATGYSQAMYDAMNNRMIVYGGAAMTDVWVLTNANAMGSTVPTWIQLNPVGPLPPVLTDYEKHAYDPVRNVLIVDDSTAGVWVLSHANGLGGTPVWSQLNVSGTGPSGRNAFTIVYSPVSNRLIAFGGSDGTTDFNDIWALTNANGTGGTPSWIPLPTGTATVPLGRSSHTAVYHPLSDTMTIFGGNGLPAETWTASNASGATKPPTWKLVNPGTLLDPLFLESAALDTNSLSMVIFGGLATDIENSVFVLSPVL
jgi:hypothetical protein